MKTSKIPYIFSAFLLLLLTSCVSEEYKASRGEREAIAEGNGQYAEEKYAEASEAYGRALQHNASSVPGRFDEALADMRLALALSDSAKIKGMQTAYERFDSIARNYPGSAVAAQSYYNMGNLMYAQNKIDESIDLYKRSLRINPSDSLARRNLRIAQLNQPPKDKNGGGGGGNDDKNQDKEKKDDKQQQQQNPQQQQQSPEQQQPQKPQQQQPAQPQQLNQGASDRILQRSQNRENEVRRQLYKSASDASINKRHRIKNW